MKSIAHYRVTGELGAGGMGRVYRAEDTKLKREVAIKVLPEEFARDDARMKRFEREAQVLASLNHPNIAAIYGIEENALVLELVEGPTLAERVASGPLPLEEALHIARQIAVGLEAAHERGVIHRDLKPANVKLTREGDVKILDFGLAKAIEHEEQDQENSNSPTLTGAATQAGILLGTAPYMSPEQAKGRPVDRRTDIWAFGCVLYEMLAGRRTFAGEDIPETLAAVLREDPDWQRLEECPESIRKLVRRCLTRDLRQRLQAIGEARIWIENRETDSAPVPVPARSGARSAVAAALVALAVVAGYWLAPRSAPDGDSFRFAIDAPEGLEYVVNHEAHNLALSPDGDLLAFVARDEGPARIWVRPLDELEARPLGGTEGARSIFFSPDGESLGFFTDDVARQTARLRRIPVGGGAAQTICNVRGVNTGAWGRDGTVLFTEVFFEGGGLFRVPSTGGEPEPLSLVVNGAPVGALRWVRFLPDGHRFLVSGGLAGSGGVFAGALDSDAARKVLDARSAAAFAPPEHILYFRDGNLMARRFDVDTLTAATEARVVIERVPYHMSGWVPVAVSANGVVATRAGGRDEPLRWRDRSGREIEDVGEAANHVGLRLSHDGRRAAVEIRDRTNGESDLWTLETDRGVATRFTSEPYMESNPVWSADDRFIAYTRHGGGRAGGSGLSVRQVQGSAVVAHVPQREDVTFSVPEDWASDGSSLLVSVLLRGSGRGDWDIERWSLSAQPEIEALMTSPFDEAQAALAPGGKLVAFVSNESGANEVYVSSFPPTGARVRVSEAGGGQPRWTKGGRELVYESGDGWLAAAPILSKDGSSLGPPERLMPAPPSWDVTADGERFLTSESGRWSGYPIVIAGGWTRALDESR